VTHIHSNSLPTVTFIVFKHHRSSTAVPN